MAKVKILGKTKSFKSSLKTYRALTKGKDKVYQIERQLYYNIIRDYHKEITRMMIEEGHDFRCPKWMGEIAIRKFKVRKAVKVDWAEYNRTKKIEPVGYEFYQRHQAKWIWKKQFDRVKNIGQYSFMESFTNRRSVSKEVQYNNKDKVYSNIVRRK